MPLINQIGYTVSEGREEAFQAWLREHEQELRDSVPPGLRYLGTYGVVFGTEKQAGFYYTLIELDGYAALDAMSEGMKSADSPFGRLIREHSGFMDYQPAAPWSSMLLRTVTDMAVFDPARPSD